MKKIAFLIPCILLLACSKQDDFLNTKPNGALSTPGTLADLQLLLNSEGIFNTKDPGLGEISSGNYYTSTAVWNTLTATERNAYIWSPVIYDAGAAIADWDGPYQQVYYANTVLDALAGMHLQAGDKAKAAQIKGAALFDRSIAFYNLLQVFTLPYDSATASVTPGIPLRLSPALTEPSVRASERDCYAQVISNLQQALPLLPAEAVIPTQPSAAAANALLARIYLVMGDYAKAFQYADACLSINHSLVDYSTLQPGYFSLSTAFLPEDIYHSISVVYLLNYEHLRSITDSVLYASYADGDLRKTVFFVTSGGQPYFRGSYDTKSRNYTGIATDEMYLTRAECSARLGNVSAALRDLNTLLKSRWQPGMFVPLTAGNAAEALALVLKERQKELLYRGLHWVDLRRLNKDSRFAVTLVRVVNNTTYTLPPGDPRYALPIPGDEIAASHIAQNPR